jgi:hypothetical protein
MVAVREGGAVVVTAVTAALLLLSGCVTLFALVLVHYERRRLELTVRVALGALRGRLLRQLCGELAVVIAAGAAMALLAAVVTIRLLPRVLMADGVDLSRIDFSIDWRVLGAGLAVAIATMMTAAAFPLARFSRATIAAGLASSSATATPSFTTTRQAMLALHIAATAIVLVMAGVFVRTVALGFSTGAGFDSPHTLFATVYAWSSLFVPDEVRTRESARLNAIADAVMAEIRNIPGVEAVVYGQAPLGAARTRELEFPQPLRAGSEEVSVRAGLMSVDENYISALGAPLMPGSDAHAAGRRGAILTQSLSRVLFPDDTPIGKEVGVGNSRYTVVGVTDLAYGSIKFGQAPALFRTDLTQPLRSAVAICLTCSWVCSRLPAAQTRLRCGVPACRCCPRFGLRGARSGVAEGVFLLTTRGTHREVPGVGAIAGPHAIGWGRARGPLSALCSGCAWARYRPGGADGV